MSRPLPANRMVPMADLLKQFMKLQKQLSLGGFPEISARKLVSTALPVANNSTDIHERVLASDLFRPYSVIGRDSYAKLDMGLFESKPNPFRKGLKENPLRDAVNEWWNEIQKELDWFRGALDFVIDDPERARNEYLEPINDMLQSLCVIPRLTWDGSALSTKLHFTSLTENHTCIFVLMLLLDEKEQLYRSLRKCKLAECQRFFLLSDSRPGRRNEYCSEEHRPDSAERMRRKRALERAARKPK